MTNDTWLWFSRHEPTGEQLADAESFGISIVRTDELDRAASASIASVEDLDAVYYAIDDAIKANPDATGICGVIPVPLAGQIYTLHGIHDREAAFANFRVLGVWQSWNVQRSEVGGKPTFRHKRWVQTGLWIAELLEEVPDGRPREMA